MLGITPEDWLKYGALGVNSMTLVLCFGLLKWALGKTFSFVDKVIDALSGVDKALARVEGKLGIENDEPD